MKKLYLLLLPFLFSSCLVFRINYQDKIVYTWKLDRVKISRWDKPETMTFTSGTFHFYPSGNLDYTNEKGQVYTGSWKMKNVRVQTSDSSGSTVTNLFITVVNYESHEMKTEIFDDLIFSGPNSFSAYLERKGRNVFYFSKLE